MSDVKPQETKVTQLSPNRLALAEHAHQTWVACPEPGIPADAMLDPKCWAHYARNPNMQISPSDIILVKPEDGTYFQELLVRDVFAGGIKVQELRRVNLDKPAEEAEQDNEHEIKHSGPRLKWRVIRLADKRELVSGLPDKDAARDWLREHKKALAA